ncbi:hypothetical protein FRC00_005013, partial [Tulasnella sp. 408]
MDTTPPPTTPSNNLPPVSFAGGVTDINQSQPDARNGMHADHSQITLHTQPAVNPNPAPTSVEVGRREPGDKLISRATADAENHVIDDVTGVKDASATPIWQESWFQGLNHLFIDIGRLGEATGYEEKRGGYGDVRVCTLDSGTPKSKLVAAKIIRPKVQCKDAPRFGLRIARELRLRSALEHPHVLPLLGYFLDTEYKIALLISEYQVHGDFKDYIGKEKPTWDIRLRLLRDSTDGLAYLHELRPPIPHGGLNMVNNLVMYSISRLMRELVKGKVLINAERQAMLTEFGLSKSLKDEPTGLMTGDERQQILRYWSPELLSDHENAPDDLSSDMWAWACLALEALTDRIPYIEKKTEPGILLAIACGHPPSETESLPIPVPDVKLLLVKSASAHIQVPPQSSAFGASQPTPEEESASPSNHESCLQGLKHLFIDMSRVHKEAGYKKMSGGYGSVRVCRLDPGTTKSTLVAAKKLVLRAECGEPQKLAIRFARELKVWAVLQHPHILPLLGYYLDEEYRKAILISEYQVYGDLKDYIKQERPACGIRLQLSLDNGPTGLTTSKGFKGTLRYSSPELLNDHETLCGELPSDIWAWACLALEVLTDKIPYADRKKEAGIITAILNRQPPGQIENLSIPVPDVKLLLSKCWTYEPEERPSASFCLDFLHSAMSVSLGNANTETIQSVSLAQDVPFNDASIPTKSAETEAIRQPKTTDGSLPRSGAELGRFTDCVDNSRHIQEADAGLAHKFPVWRDSTVPPPQPQFTPPAQAAATPNPATPLFSLAYSRQSTTNTAAALSITDGDWPTYARRIHEPSASESDLSSFAPTQSHSTESNTSLIAMPSRRPQASQQAFEAQARYQEAQNQDWHRRYKKDRAEKGQQSRRQQQ